MVGRPASWEARTPEWVVNGVGRLTPAQIKRVRTSMLLTSQTWYMPLVFASLVAYNSDTVQRRLEVSSGSVVHILALTWFTAAFLGLAWLLVSMSITVRRIIRGIREANTGLVTTIDGTLTWRGRQYIAVAGALRLRLLNTLVPAGFPGSYRIYYLPQSRVIIAAEELGEPPPYAEWYRRHPIFDRRTLPFNRQGRRAPVQLGPASVVLVAIPIALLFLIVCIAPLFIHGPNDMYAYLGQFVILGISLIAYFAPWYITDMRPGRVASVEGVIERDASQRYQFEDAITLGGQRFSVSKPQYDALAESYCYRVYYTTRGRNILNAEPISEILTPSIE